MARASAAGRGAKCVWELASTRRARVARLGWRVARQARQAHLSQHVRAPLLVQVVHIWAEQHAVDHLLHALLPHGHLGLGRAQTVLQFGHLLSQRCNQLRKATGSGPQAVSVSKTKVKVRASRSIRPRQHTRRYTRAARLAKLLTRISAGPEGPAGDSGASLTRPGILPLSDGEGEGCDIGDGDGCVNGDEAIEGVSGSGVAAIVGVPGCRGSAMADEQNPGALRRKCVEKRKGSPRLVERT